MARITVRYNRLEAELVNTDGMTKRQEEVARLFIQDKTKFEIAKELGISPATAENHLDRLKDRFEAKTRLDLICQMWMHGILEARGMVAALVVALCVISAFPMARSSRTSTRGSVRQEIRISKTARKELNVPIGVIA